LIIQTKITTNPKNKETKQTKRHTAIISSEEFGAFEELILDKEMEIALVLWREAGKKDGETKKR
jgi:hypothetical protein